MPATPRTSFSLRPIINLNLELGRMPIEILTIVCNPEPCLVCFKLQRMGQTEIAKLEMVPISLAISCYVNQISRSRRTNKVLHQSPTRRKRLLESNRPRASCGITIVSLSSLLGFIASIEALGKNTPPRLTGKKSSALTAKDKMSSATA